MSQSADSESLVQLFSNLKRMLSCSFADIHEEYIGIKENHADKGQESA